MKEYYDKTYFETPIEQGLNSLNGARDLPLLLRLLNPQSGDNILDIGCGLGRFDEIIAHKGANVIGIDISEYAIQKAKEKFSGCKNLQFLCANALEIKYENQFDKVFCYHVIEHLNSMQSEVLLQKIYFSLKDNGILVIGLPINDFTLIRRILRFISHRPLGRASHLQSFSLEKIKNDLSISGLNPVNVFPLSYRDMKIPELTARIPFFRQAIFCADILAIKKSDKPKNS